MQKAQEGLGHVLSTQGASRRKQTSRNDNLQPGIATSARLWLILPLVIPPGRTNQEGKKALAILSTCSFKPKQPTAANLRPFAPGSTCG